MLVDTHCHLDFPEFDQDRDEVIKRAKNEGIDSIVNVGSSLESSFASLELAKKYDSIYATIGIHPHEADRVETKTYNALRELAKNDKVVAIGEIGLDYYLPAARLPVGQGRQGKNYSKAENQKSLFKSLVKLAKDLALPLIIHMRLAQEDTLKIIKEEMPIKAVIHCFSGDEYFLKECLDLGFLISFTCNITYKKAQNLRNMVKLTPMDKLLLETDAPFLSPEGFRGKRNEPMQVKLLAEEIARIKKINIEEVARITTDNARKFFALK